MKYKILSSLNNAALFKFLNEFVTAQFPIVPGQTYTNLQAASLDIKPGDAVYLHPSAYNDFKPFTNSSEFEDCKLWL